jgi:hypothetical protein
VYIYNSVNNNPDDSNKIKMVVNVTNCFLIFPNRDSTNALCIEGELKFDLLREKLSETRKAKSEKEVEITHKNLTVDKLCFYMCKYSSINEDVKNIAKRRMFDPLTGCYLMKETVQYTKQRLINEIGEEIIKYNFILRPEQQVIFQNANISLTITVHALNRMLI